MLHERYHEEFAKVKNQDVTINRLQDKLDAYEKSLDETVAGRVKEAERKLERVFAQKQKEVDQEQLSSVQQLGEAEQETATMRGALDATNSELFDMKSKYDDDMASRASEMELVVGDLDRMTEKAATLEKELENERIRMAEMQSSPDSVPVQESMDAMAVANLESEVAAKERELSQVLDDYRELQDAHAQMNASTTNRMSGYDAALETRAAELAELEGKLKGYGDYETIKHELNVLKGIEFKSEMAQGGGAAKSLDALLASKNRTLDAANTDLKRESARLAARLQKLEADSTAAIATVQEQASLIARLEGDLTTVQNGGASSDSTSGGKRGGGDGSSGGDFSNVPLNAEVTESVLTGKTESQGADESLLPIVSSQRDRFRARNIEIEAENRQHQTVIATLKSEIDTVRQDNVKLYEKLKFVQGYQGSGGGGGGGDETTKRYSQGYEESINPFKAFNAKEKQRKYMNMSPADKISIALSRWVLSNKTARLVFVVYLLILHFLIFFVTAHVSHQASSQTPIAEECMHRFAEHMSHLHDTGDHHIPDNLFEIDGGGGDSILDSLEGH